MNKPNRNRLTDSENKLMAARGEDIERPGGEDEAVRSIDWQLQKQSWEYKAQFTECSQ